jgi:hypothetical protein
MMILRILLAVIPMMSLSCQTTNTPDDSLRRQITNTPDASLRRRERELAARLRWDILWNEVPPGFRVPKGGAARLTAYQTVDTFWYCSRDLGVCAQYSLEDRRLLHRTSQIKCDGKQDDRSSVLKFAGQNPKLSFPSEIRTDKLPHPVGILWTPTIELSTRVETVKKYKQLRPTELEGLRDWLRTRFQDAGYRSITIACFAPSDPTVFIYGDRPAEPRGAIIFQVFWDREREEWVYAGLLEREHGPERFEELKATIQLIACDTIKFN